MVASQNDALTLDGLSLAEAFRTYVLEDSAVASLANRMMQKNEDLKSVFEDGKYPGPYSDYTWPLDVPASELTYQFARPVVIVLGAPDSPVPKEILDLSELLAARMTMLRDLLRSGRLLARGTFAMTGLVGEIASQQWARHKLMIDVQNSDLLENKGREPVVMWSGLTLHVPASAPLEKHSIDLTPAASPRSTAHRSSVELAVAALWPEGIPQGMTVKDRDNKINDWQRKNDRAVTSGKTIKRHLDGK